MAERQVAAAVRATGEVPAQPRAKPPARPRPGPPPRSGPRPQAPTPGPEFGPEAAPEAGPEFSAEPEAFGTRDFRAAAEQTLGQLVRHIDDRSVRGLELADPRVLVRTARSLMTTARDRIADFDQDRLAAIVDLYLRTGIQVHSPGAMGRQFSGTVPLAAVVEFAGSVVNQPSSFYEAAQLPKAAEQIMAAELNEFIGWDPGRLGLVTTSGGSLANLTALLAARNRAFPRFWADGTAAFGAGRARPAVAVGADAHYSVARAAGVLGIGEAQIVRLPLNAAKQIDPASARTELAAAKARGLNVFCLVASAGTTAVGAFDPLDELGDLARESGLWLHVDELVRRLLPDGDRMVRRPRGDRAGELRTRTFEFAGRSGDVLHLGDTQYAAARAYAALREELRPGPAGRVLDLDEVAHEVQFVNQREARLLTLIAAVDDVPGSSFRLEESLGAQGCSGCSPRACRGRCRSTTSGRPTRCPSRRAGTGSCCASCGATRRRSSGRRSARCRWCGTVRPTGGPGDRLGGACAGAVPEGAAAGERHRRG